MPCYSGIYKNDDITIVVSDTCYLTWPCQHKVTINNDVSELMCSPDIETLLKDNKFL